ncbi:MAG: GxxExxY protein [Rhodocyclaceae bacterium]|nr:GxxExxY protein [Rhodocyclaceae bacterium]
MEINDISGSIVDSALKVHSALGPGLLESVYEACLAHEIETRGLAVRRQVCLPVRYGDTVVEAGLRLDLVVAESVVVEVKAIESFLPVHTAQLLTYLKLGRFPLGLLLNFNVLRMKEGVRRVVNGS